VRAAGAGAPILITTSLQVDDLALLKAYKKKRAVRLPLSAQNKKQWDEELRLTARDARRLERAQAWAAGRQANSYLPRRMDYSGFWVSYFVVVPFGLLLLCAMLVDTVLRENVAFSRHVSNESFIVQMPNSGPSGSHAIPRQ